MATVIDALVVSLGLDASKFTDEQKQAAASLRQLESSAEATEAAISRTAQTMAEAMKSALQIIRKEEKERSEALRRQEEEDRKKSRRSAESVKKVADAYTTLKREVLGYVAAIASVEGVKTLLSGAIQVNTMVGNASQLLGISARELDTWTGAAERLSVSADSVVGSLRSIATEQARFRNGVAPSQDQLTAMSMLGLDPNSVYGKGVSLDSAERSIIKALRKAPAAEREMWANRLGVGSGVALLAGKSDADIDRALSGARADSSNANAAADSVRRINGEWSTFTQKFRNFVNKELTEFEGIITSIIKQMDKAADWANDHPKEAAGGILAGTAVTSAVVMKSAKALLSRGASSAGAPATSEAAQAVGSSLLGGIMRGAGAVGAFLYALNGGDLNEGEGAFMEKFRTDHGYSASGGIPRGIGNNNPGKLEFHDQPGAVPEDGPGRFAHFGTMSQGIAALARQLRLYGLRGENTIRSIISKYAPSSENDTQGYIDFLSKKMGFSADQPLNLSDAQTLRSMIRGISDLETRPGAVSDSQISQGLALYAGTGFVDPSIRMGGGAMLGSRQVSSNTSTTDVRIGTQNIYTQAKDGREVAGAFHASVKHFATASYADTGLS